MSKWIAEFDLEDSDTLPEHMDLEYKEAKLDFHCRPMWIPVTERLPDKSGEYLVTIRYEDGGSVDTDMYGYNSHWRKWNYEELYGGTVIAWQPKPEPWKGEQNNEKN